MFAKLVIKIRVFFINFTNRQFWAARPALRGMKFGGGKRGRAKIPGGRPLSNSLPFCPPERSVWRAPARRSLGEGGKRAVSSVQNRFGFRHIIPQI